jgi:hypothetical protein
VSLSSRPGLFQLGLQLLREVGVAQQFGLQQLGAQGVQLLTSMFFEKRFLFVTDAPGK